MRLNLTSYDYMRHGALVREYSERKGNLAHHDTECEPRLTFTRLPRLVGRGAIVWRWRSRRVSSTSGPRLPGAGAPVTAGAKAAVMERRQLEYFLAVVDQA